MSIYLEAERDRLAAEIQDIHETGEIASDGCWIDSYLAKNQQGRAYEYYKLVAEEPIFTGAQGGRTKTLHLGKAGSDRYHTALLTIRRRNAIKQLEAQVAKVEELIVLDRTMPSAAEFQAIRVD